MTLRASPITRPLAAEAANKPPLRKRQMPAWIGVAGCVLSFVMGSGSEFVFGVWDRKFPKNKPPEATIKVAPKEGNVPLTVVARASASSDPEGRQMTYSWSVNNVLTEAQGGVYTHTFTERGTYAIAVEVKDEKGLVDAADDTITVREEYSEQQYVDDSRTIERLLGEGDFEGALEEANRLRYSCVHLAIPPERCATLHSRAAEARLKLGRYEEGFESISIATKLMPRDVIYMVRQSEFHIVLNHPALAVADLVDLAKDNRIGPRGLLYLGIAHAIEGNYGEAEAYINRLTRSTNQFAAAAEFTLVVTELLQRKAKSAVSVKEISSIVCGDWPLRTLFLTETRIVERHIIILRTLIGRLDPGVQNSLQEAMACS